MKLSLRKRLGWIHVKGGKFLKVAMEHAVHSGGRSELEDANASHDDVRWAYAQVGDLVVEIIAVKTGKVLGHSYLSGPAIQCNRYTPAMADWFEPAEGQLLELPERPDPRAGEEAWREFTHKIVETLVEAKYSGDLSVFEVIVENHDEGKEALEYFSRAVSYERNDNGDGGRAHLVGVFGNKKGVCGLIHQQPEHHVSKEPMTGFQAGLVLSAVKEKA